MITVQDKYVPYQVVEINLSVIILKKIMKRFCRYEGIQEGGIGSVKHFILIKKVKAAISVGYPYPTERILFKLPDGIGIQPILFCIDCELKAIVPYRPSIRSKPYEFLIILVNMVNNVTGKTFSSRKMLNPRILRQNDGGKNR
jgi:hypothetical protein